MKFKDLTGSLLFASFIVCLCQDYGGDVSVIMTVADEMVQGTIDVEISAELFREFHNCLCHDNTKSCDLHLEDSNGFTVRAEEVRQNVRRGHQDTRLSAYYKCILKRPQKIRCCRLLESWKRSNFVSSTSYRLSNTSCDFDCVGFVWLSDDESLYFEDDTDLDNEDCEHESYTTSESTTTIEVSSSSTTTTTTATVTHTSEVTVRETSTSEPNVTMLTENPSKSESNMGLIVGVTIGLIVLLILVVIVVIILWRKKRGMTNSDQFCSRARNLKTLQDDYLNRGASVSPDLLYSEPNSVAEQNDIDMEHNKTHVRDQYVNCGNKPSSGSLNSPFKSVDKPHILFHSGYDGNVSFNSYENHKVLPKENSHADQSKPSSTSCEVVKNSNDKEAAPLPYEKPTKPEFVYSLQRKNDNLDLNKAQRGPKLQIENEIENPQIGHNFDRIDCPEHLSNSENTSNNKATASTFLVAERIGDVNNDYGYSSIGAYYGHHPVADDPIKHRSAATDADRLPSDNIYTELKDNYETVETRQEDNTATADERNGNDNIIYNQYSTIQETDGNLSFRNDDLNSTAGYAHLNETAKKVTNPYNVLLPAGGSIDSTEPYPGHVPFREPDNQKSRYSLAQPITDDAISPRVKVLALGPSSSTEPGAQYTSCSTAAEGFPGENPKENCLHDNGNKVYFELEREEDVVYPIYD